MMSKALTLLAVASLASEAFAAAGHGHMHRHQKKSLVTEWETVTDWVTVTVTWDGSSSKVFVENTHTVIPVTVSNSTTTTSTTSTPSSTSTSTTISTTSTTPTSTSTTSTSIPTPTSTSISSAAPTVQVNVLASHSSSVAPPPTSTSAAPIASVSVSVGSGSSSSGSSGGPLRGLAYNDGSLLSLFTGSKAGWKYNWGQVDDSTAFSDLPFVPMLWGATPDHTSTWESNANAAIAAGSDCLVSFNEPDNAGQANMSPAAAAQAHIQYMNPFSSKARIGSPAITNSEQSGQGTNWLTEFISACDGQCALDFVVCHWYNPADAQEFVSHLADVHNASGGLPVWVTEFEPLGASDADISSFLTEVFSLLESSEYSFVERIAYFMVATDNLVGSTALSTYGEVYASG